MRRKGEISVQGKLTLLDVASDWKGVRIEPGDLVQLRGDHPHAHQIGTYRGMDYIPLMQKFAPRVEFDDGDCYVFNFQHWERA